MERTSPEIFRIITLSSGESRGSNILAIHHYFLEHQLPVQIAYAVFTSVQAPAFGICETEGIKAIHIAAKKDFEARVLDLVHSEGISLIALCGFMRLLSADFIQSVGIPILNIHPSLLPKYGGKGMYGMNVHKAVYQAKECISGASVHIVDPVYDNGELISSVEEDISTCNSPDEIAAKVLKIEHSIYAPAIYKVLTR